MEFAIALVVDDENPDVGDFIVNNNQFVFTEDLAYEVAQRLKTRFEFFKGSWFLDQNQGRPMFYEKDVPDSVIRAEITKVIEGTSGVRRLVSLSLVRTTERELGVVFVAQLEDESTFRSTDYGVFVVTPGVEGAIR